jgi:uncharacterized protein YbjT (DUF2867 family)
MSGRSALVVGATGLVGGHVVSELLGRAEYARVSVLVRRPLGRGDPKLVEHVAGDFEHLADHAEAMRADDVYACLGTTIKVAGSEERFRRVDHDYTVEVARAARNAGATRVAVVSSIGSSPESRTFYLRVKGETERDVEALGYETTSIARPSFLFGDRKGSRPAEAVGIAVTRALSFALVGGLRQYRAIEARVVARALVRASLDGAPGVRILLHDDLVSLGAS